MPMDKNRQYRGLEFSFLETEEMESNYLVEGYATTFEPYLFYEGSDGNVYEKFEKSAFDNCDMSDVIFQYNHTGKVFARMSNDTLQLRVDDKGLYVKADLSKSDASRKMYEEIKAGLVTKMSWGFKLGEWEFDESSNTFIHKSVKKIYDVSAVSIPANEDTSISARDFVNGEIDKIKLERLKSEKEKLLLEIEMEMYK